MNKNMISSTSTYVNANVNPVNADVIKVDLVDKSDDPELVKDWRDPSGYRQNS